MAARALWKGQISLGLVTVPVKLATAVRQKDIAFHMMDPDGTCRLRTKLVCPETGKEYNFGETAKGYELSPGEYVLLDKEEIKNLKAESDRTMRVEQFVTEQEIDPVYFDHTYYLLPDKGGERSFHLLWQTMKKSGKVALGRLPMRGQRYLAAVRVSGQALVLHTMHYADEVLSAADAGIVLEDEPPRKKELDMAQHLVEALTEKFDPKSFRDEYRERVEDLIRRKAAGEEVTLPDVEPPPPTYNIAKALEASLSAIRGKSKAKPQKKKTTRRRKSA